jgi:HlyD family secretion protein
MKPSDDSVVRQLESQPEIEGVTYETEELMSWSALEFIRAPSSAVLQWSIIFVAFACVMVVVLSSLIEFDVTIKAPGEVSSDLESRITQAQASGRITEIRVQQDQLVARGQTLGLIGMNSQTQQKMQDALEAIDQLETSLRSQGPQKLQTFDLSILPQSSDIDSSDALTAAVDLEQQIKYFRNLSNRQSSALSDELRPLRKKVRSLNEKIQKLKKSKQRDLLGQYLEQAQEELDATQAQIISAENESALRLQEAQGNVLKAIQSVQSAFKEFLDMHVLTSAIDGQVFEIYKRQNQYIKADEEFAKIKPKGSELVTSVRLFAKDMVKIEPGQTILYRMEAYPVQTYGFFKGEVLSYIQTKEVPEDLREYIVTGSIEAPEDLSAALKENMRFVAGMKFNAEVVVDRQSGTQMLKKLIFERR